MKPKTLSKANTLIPDTSSILDTIAYFCVVRNAVLPLVFGNPFTVTTNEAWDRFRQYRKQLLVLAKSFGTQISGLFNVLRIEEDAYTIRENVPQARWVHVPSMKYGLL